MTVWKQIPSVNKYEASDDGNIRNARTKKVLKPFNDPLQKYDRISIYDCGRKQKVMVHTLVALAFLGDPPSSDCEIDHMNTNIHDNRPCNLQYVPQSINHRNPVTQFNREVAKIRRAIASGKYTQEDIMRLVNALKKA